MVTAVTSAILYAAAGHDGRGRLMVERGIGYWITAGGEYVPVPPRVSHADVVRAVTGSGTFDDAVMDDADREALTADANAFAVGRGWSRVRIYPGDRVAYLDYGSGRRREHDRAMAELLDELGLTGVAVKYTDEEGNYVSP